MMSGLAASLGALALFLASIGIYGVVAYFVVNRTREIGIRVALGAHSLSVLAHVLRRTMRPIVVGAAIGIAASIAVSDLLRGMLFSVSPLDLVGLGVAAVFVVTVAGTACMLASRRATRACGRVMARSIGSMPSAVPRIWALSRPC